MVGAAVVVVQHRQPHHPAVRIPREDNLAGGAVDEAGARHKVGVERGDDNLAPEHEPEAVEQPLPAAMPERRGGRVGVVGGHCNNPLVEVGVLLVREVGADDHLQRI
eukprot:scaffold45385_cov42-Phaeocystis_antarctica.AAC.1